MCVERGGGVHACVGVFARWSGLCVCVEGGVCEGEQCMCRVCVPERGFMLCIYCKSSICVCFHLCLVHMEMSSFNDAALHPNTLVSSRTCRYHLYSISLPFTPLTLYCLILLAPSIEKQLCPPIIGIYKFIDMVHFAV